VLWAPRDLPELGPDAAGDLPRYREWADRRQAQRLAAPVVGGDQISVVLVVEQADPAWLWRCLASLAAQRAARWRLLVAVVGTPDPTARAALDEAIADLGEGRAEVRGFADSTPPAEAVAALLAADGSAAVALLGPDDQLAPDALALLGAALAGADLAYADEDRVDAGGLVSDPVLKPDWSPELCLSWGYVGRPLLVRRDALDAAGGVRPVAGGDWEHDLVLRVAERAGRVAHVAEVLCHRRLGAAAGAGGPGAVAAALERHGARAAVDPGPLPGTWRVRRRPAGRPSVSAVVPFRDAPRLLRACVDSVTDTAGDADLELVLVDNGSVEPETRTLLDRLARRPGVVVLHDPRPFNWAALNNAAVGAATGEVLLFLNNDIEARRTGWLEPLCAQALRPEVGVVGARLLYPSGRVQHAGMVLGLAGAAGHVLAGLAGDRPGYLGMAVLARDCSAVTGACMAVRREVFGALGGFDESLGLDLNDVDLCLRAAKEGLRVVYEPAAELVHHESPSRGTSGSTDDQLRFLERWGDEVVAGDPFLNANLTRVDCTAALRRGDEEEGWIQWRSTLTSS
jgi:GT2 family glycosyltransferase